MRFQYILFDLDGTLSASAPGITKAAQYALHRMGIEEPNAAGLTFFVGPPLNLTFRGRYGMSDDESAQAIAYFRERYNSRGVFDNTLYPGIREMLAALHGSGHRLAIASSKPDNLVHKVLEHFAIDGCFDVIVGSDPVMELDNKAARDNKQQMVQKALTRLSSMENSGSRKAVLPAPGLQDEAARAAGTIAPTGDDFRASCAMVGDRFYDINGARANHVTAIGVTYGYGSREELEQAGADYVVDSVPELEALLLQ